MHMVAQDLLQGSVQQVRGAVSSHDGLPALHVDGCGDGLPHAEGAGDHLAGVHELAALVLLNIRHLEGAVGSLNGAVVSHLAAHLGIERRLVQHQDALHALSQLVPQLTVGHQGQDSALLAGAIIAYELRGGHVLAELDACPRSCRPPPPSPRSGRWGSHRCRTA
ncbi:Uncharacterised protein [uncultured Blautia sp.]|nr:Uncharacterised protein [uncultured Blautia sp.]